MNLNASTALMQAALASRLETPAHATSPASPSRRTWHPPIAILGVPFDNVTTQQTVSIIEEMVASREPHYMATANVDFIVQAMHDVELRRILMDAHLILCDGMPLVWASRLLGNPLPERVAGSDLVPLLLQVAEKKGYRVFFLGGEEKVAHRALENIRAKHPALQIAGSYSPPFAPLLEMDHEAIGQKIRASGADLLFVSFGCPKQEKWIAMNYRHLGVPVSVGVGATIDFLAGTVKRAPRWMQMSGLEWIFRLLQEPRRLFRRYFTDLVSFGGGILKQLWQLRRRRLVRSSMPPLAEPATHVLKLPPRLDALEIRDQPGHWETWLATPRPLILDATDVQFIDSTGVGLLVRLQKALRHAGHPLVLSSPTPSLMHALKLMKLDTLFDTAPDHHAAEELLNARLYARPTSAAATSADGTRSIAWKDELTAVNVDDVWQPTERVIHQSHERGTRLEIDLSRLRFVDSAGVGLMVCTRKKCRSLGIDVRFTKPSPTVLGVIQMLKMEDYLLEA